MRRCGLAIAGHPTFSDNFFPKYGIFRIMPSKLQKATGTMMAGPSGGAGSRAQSRRRSLPRETATRGARILERLAAGLSIAEAAGLEGTSPRRARELVAETVAGRGFDP